MKTVALLPMKANSERVPGKNFKLLGDRPLFRWMLDTLVSMDEIDLVVINTDAADILVDNGIDSYSKVLLRERRNDLRGDLVSMNLILGDDISNVEADTYLMTHTTNPFLSAVTVRTALMKWGARGNTYDSLFSVNRWQARFYREGGEPINHDPNNLLRTQDLEPWFEENSCLYLFTETSFSGTQARIGTCPILFETPRLESIDIDGPEEWALAEALAPHVIEAAP